MSAFTPRVRMFAGPNGSGKSALKSILPAALLGQYINPDEIEKEIRTRGCLVFADYGVTDAGEESIRYFENSAFLRAVGMTDLVRQIQFDDRQLIFRGVEINAYFASVLADFLRQKLLARNISFTFETVMSSSDKVALLKQAQATGYRTYLYYVATEDPEINISRVRNRVRLGGHSVPEDKIVSRYWRSLDLLMAAIRFSHRAYVFDNSSSKPDRSHTWLAEITNGRELEMKAGSVPGWFRKAVLDKIGQVR